MRYKNICWSSFGENYLPYIEDDKSLYDEEDIEEDTEMKHISLYNKSSESLRKSHQLMRSGIVGSKIKL
jgi:hypothetical protein